MLFSIYHPERGEMNIQCTLGVFKYQLVATVNAISLQHAFKLAQNDFNEEYAKLGHRSTSVGDLIRGNTLNMVKPVGFQEIPEPKGGMRVRELNGSVMLLEGHTILFHIPNKRWE